MRCPKCDSLLQNGQCLRCGMIYLPRCPECGNTLDFETLGEGGLDFLKCSQCRNQTVFEWVTETRS